MASTNELTLGQRHVLLTIRTHLATTSPASSDPRRSSGS